MTIMPIYLYPHPVLRQKCTPITAFDDELKKLADDMIETMQNAKGVGLAAPQVGVTKRIFVLDVGILKAREGEKETSELYTFVNPEILEASDEKTVNTDGCLSLPQLFDDHDKRAGYVKVKAQNLQGEWFEMVLEDYPAFGFQHEYDHLEGKLFVDYLGPVKRQMLMNKYKKVIRNLEDAVSYPTVAA